ARLLTSLDDQTILLLADWLVVPRNGQQPFHLRVVNYATQNDADGIHAGVRYLVQQLVQLRPGHATMLPGSLKPQPADPAVSAPRAAADSSHCSWRRAGQGSRSDPCPGELSALLKALASESAETDSEQSR